MMWGYGFSWGGMTLMMLGMTLFWIVLLAVLAWAVIRWLTTKTTTFATHDTGAQTSAPSAEEILRQRYARGEIDTATFERMREQLGTTAARGSEYENQAPFDVR